MFTGIVEEMGRVSRVTERTSGLRVNVGCSSVLQDLAPGDSVAVNGLCLTAVEVNATSFAAEVMPESLRRSTLSEIKRGARVNLERAVSADGRFGGHLVSGHIDGVGRISNRKTEANAEIFVISARDDVVDFLVPKGSVAVDGVSLTVASLRQGEFTVSVVPQTLNNTTLQWRKAGDSVNIEVDLIGKYVWRFTSDGKSDVKMSMDFLKENGFGRES